MSEFELIRLSNLVAKVKVGFVGSINDYYCDKKVGVPLIRTTDITDQGLDYTKLKFVTQEFHKKNKKSQIKKGDLIIARHGENGKANVFNEDFEAQVLNAVIIETDQNKLESSVLKYFFDSPFIKKQIQGVVKGSVQGVINTAHIADVLLPINKKINYTNHSKVLSDLDAKIELNNKINTELEAMAKLIYDYWFVQFEFPFDFAQGKPSKDGKPYKSSGGKMVWSAELKREIPEGWEVKRLKDIAQTGSGGTPLRSKTEYYLNGNIPWINSGEVNASFIVKAEKFITQEGMNKSSAKLFKKGTILMAMYGATAGQVSLIDIEACTNQAICGINPHNKEMTAYLKFGLEDLYKYLISLSSGSARDNLSQDKIRELHFVIPKLEILSDFDRQADAMLRKILVNMKENQKLAELRDWLLPMLMNGQVRVDKLDAHNEPLKMAEEEQEKFR